MSACAILVGLVVPLDAIGVFASDEPTIFSIHFSDQSEASVYDWLGSKGFELKQDADDRDRIALERSNRVLRIFML